MRIGNFEFYRVKKHDVGVRGVEIDEYIYASKEYQRPFARADVESILMMISSRLQNFVFSSSIDYQLLQILFDFLRANSLRVLVNFFYEGRVSIDTSEIFNPKFADGSMSAGCLVEVCDEIYLTTGRTRAQELKPYLDLLNVINDSDLNLIENYGAMGILSPENSANADGYLDDEQRQELQKEYTRRYGVKFGKWALMITRTPIKYQNIELPITALQLNEKRKMALTAILQYMNIPKELHAAFESAKYANRNEAELDIYTNCITSWARVFIKIASECYKNIRQRHQQFKPCEMWFDIVGVAALQAAQHEERLKISEEIEIWKKLRSEFPEKNEEINKRMLDLIENL